MRPGVGVHGVPGGGEQLGGVLRGGDGERVDDAAARQVAEVRREPGEPVGGRGQLEHAEPQRRAGQRAAQHGDGAARPGAASCSATSATTRAFAVAVVASTGVPAGSVASRSRMRR